MKETVRSILKLLEQRRFRNEQHVRFSLVARICEKLNWDIWNPYVFDTEDQTDKFTQDVDGKSTRGKIDIALYKTTKNDRTAHIFIEVKMVGELVKNIQKSRDQLEQYSLKISPPLSVLTDGVRWEFFLNCLNTKKGKYAERLINSFDLSEDNLDAKCAIINCLMNSSVTKTALEALGRKMRKEFKIIQNITDVKQQAIREHPDDSIKQIYAAQEMIRHKHQISIPLKKLGELWNIRLALGGLMDVVVNNKFSPGVKNDVLQSYTGMSIVEISIKNQEVIKVSGCAGLKKAVYNFIVSEKAMFTLKDNNVSVGIHEEASQLRKPVQLVDGRYIEGNLSTDGAVKQCWQALEEAGFLKSDLILGYK